MSRARSLTWFVLALMAALASAGCGEEPQEQAAGSAPYAFGGWFAAEPPDDDRRL
jgi:hypothetical protein